MNGRAEIRRRYHLDKESISSLSKAFTLSRPTIRKHINTVEEPVYQRQSQPCRMLGEFIDRNRYSVPAHWANTVVSVRLTADCVRIVAEAQMIAEHARCFGRDQLSCDPWHYLPILEKSQVQSGMVRRLIEATKPKHWITHCFQSPP